MLELVSEGVLSPSAESVAARAGVGLRSVFRHFNDMDSLYLEMSGAIEAQVAQAVSTPFAPGSWSDQLKEMVERRVATFERLSPFLRAASVSRHRSTALDHDYRRLTAISRENLRRVLATAQREDVLEALDLVLSFEVWTRLRNDQHLTLADTKTVIHKLVTAVLGA